jgi:hypothetical protein
VIIESLKELTDAEIAILEKHSPSVILIWAGGSEQDDSVMIIRRKHDVKPTPYPGGPWAICSGNRCFNRSRKWELEPTSIGRTVEFLKRCLFDSLKEAIEFWKLQGNSWKPEEVHF